MSDSTASDPAPSDVTGRGEGDAHQQSAREGRGGVFAGWPLRRTLVTALVVLVAIITMFIAGATSLALQRSLERSLDEKVYETSARALRPLVNYDRRGGVGANPNDGGIAGLGGDFLLLVASGNTAVTNVVFDTNGQPTSLTGQQIDALLTANLGSTPRTVDLGGNLGRWRLVGTRGENGTVISGLPTADLEHAVGQVRWFTLALSLLGVGLIGMATWLIVRRSLRPLDEVAALARHVTALPLSGSDVTLTERVPTAYTDRRTEVGQVGAAFNELLDHVENSLRDRSASEAKLRRFVADASHELRTPLASIRGYAELTRRETEPVPERVRHALDRVQSEAERMTALVEELLMLARLDSRRAPATSPVDLTRIVLDATGDAHAAGPKHVWQLDLPDEAVELVGDPAQLTRVVVNLLANARTHTPAGTTVLTTLTTSADAVCLRVADDGPGIPASLTETLFDRFTRGDASRGGHSTGLGLSIVKAVAEAHGGTVGVHSRTADSDAGDSDNVETGTEFVVTLPRR